MTRLTPISCSPETRHPSSGSQGDRARRCLSLRAVIRAHGSTISPRVGSHAADSMCAALANSQQGFVYAFFNDLWLARTTRSTNVRSHFEARQWSQLAGLDRWLLWDVQRPATVRVVRGCGYTTLQAIPERKHASHQLCVVWERHAKVHCNLPILA